MIATELQELVDIEAKIKELEKKQKPLKEKIKEEMIKTNQMSVKAPTGETINLTLAERVTMKDKDAFVAFLAKNQLRGCIDITYEPNLDRALVEVANGKIQADEIEGFYKKTPVYTMKIKDK